jgi:Tol biopolymer transport system component
MAAPANGGSSGAAISADGRTVVFESAATNLVAGPDLNGVARDVYVYVVATGEISRGSVDQAGRQRPESSSYSPTVSADGRRIAFHVQRRGRARGAAFVTREPRLRSRSGSRHDAAG